MGTVRNRICARPGSRPTRLRQTGGRTPTHRWGSCFALLRAAIAGAVLLLGSTTLGQEPVARDHEIDRAQQDQLRALGYVAWEPIDERDQGRSGVTVWDRERAAPGFHFWNSLPRQEAVLTDLSGLVLHRWKRATGGSWGHVELLPNGDILILHERPDLLIRLDWHSNLVWQKPMSVSHDVDVNERGEIYVINSKRQNVRTRSTVTPIVDDYISILAADGTPLREISMFRLLGGRVDLAAARRRAVRDGEAEDFLDVLHVNTLAILRENHGWPFVKGSVLFAARNLDLIGLLDVDRGAVVWTGGAGALDWPHQPTMLRSGNVLVFDNGTHRGFSRVVELDRAKGQVVWTYRARAPEVFFSRIMGGTQALGNGNVLITESTRGRVFEVTRKGEIVWEFFNPDTEEGARAGIYRMRRIGEQSLHADRWNEIVALGLPRQEEESP